MKDRVVKQEFIEMRAQGFSYRAMSGALGVSMRSLNYWNNEFADEIAAARARETEAVHRQYAMIKEKGGLDVTKGLERRSRFIEMRAEGLSYRTIAEELGVSRATLVNWNREFADEIATVRAEGAAALHAKYLMMKEHRLQVFGEQLERIRDELRRRDLRDVGTAELLRLFLRCYRALSMEAEPKRLQVAVGLEAGMDRWEAIVEKVGVVVEEKKSDATGRMLPSG
jgi:transposase